MDGVLAHDFDMIDEFIARHHLDPEIATEAMAMDSGLVARMLVDMNVPREVLVRLAHGMTPAKLADVVSRLNALEIAFAYSKMRARKTPGNQAHVTNAKDDPLQLAALIHGKKDQVVVLPHPSGRGLCAASPHIGDEGGIDGPHDRDSQTRLDSQLLQQAFRLRDESNPLLRRGRPKIQGEDARR